MIYIFDKKQAIIKVLTNDDFTAAHQNFKINTATKFEFSLPASKALPSGSKYVAIPHPLNDSKFIMLRLIERVDNTETIDYSAYELAYQELATDGYIEDKRPQNQSALNLMKIALNGSNWELNNVNVSGTATTNFYYVDRLSAISKVVDLLGGEIVFYIEIQGNAISGRYMDYLARQGADTSKVFASGSNLLTVERQSDTSGIYTAILPRGKGKEIDNGDADTPDGYGRRINIADVEWKKSTGNPLDKPKGSIVLSDPDATAEWGQINGNARLLLQTYDDIDDVNVLINLAYKTLQSVNHPQIQYSATVADVGGLSLGDTVLIMHGDRDLSYKTRVFEVKYDLLSPDQTELSLGDDLSSNSITSQINSLNAVADTTSSQTQWTINQIGRPGTTYGATAPDSPKVGDIWFKYLPDGGTEIHRWNGDIWELLASPTTADDIATAVDDAVAQAKEHTATAIEQNNTSQQEVMNDIAKSQADLAIKDGDFNNKAQAMADKALSDAKANTATVAQDMLDTANDNLNTAKQSLTTDLQKEVSDRETQVSGLDTKAKGYADQAKQDAIDAATTADGVINKKIDDTKDGITTTINQNKSDADGKITTAQSTATQALNEVKTKVSQTDYNTKTGQLQTDLTTTTQTANQANTDIVSIKQTDTSQDSRMTSIESDASGVKTTVSEIQTKQGKQSGDISTLQQRADGFDATVTKVNDLSVGGRNYFITNAATNGYLADNGVIGSATNHDMTSDFISVSPNETWIATGRYNSNASSSPEMVIAFQYYDVNKEIVGVRSRNTSGKYVTQYSVTKTIPSGVAYMRVSSGWVNDGYGSFKIEKGNIATDWTPAPEDVDSATAKAQLTADNASAAVTKLTSADGVITKAQADIQANADAITAKVSKTVYDQDTGDLNQAISKAQSTADGAVSTVGNYQTSNDKRVKAAESTIEQHSNDIAARVVKTDYDNNNSQLNTRFTKVEATANGASTTVGKLNTTVNNLGQINQLFNTEFSPDFAGWINGNHAPFVVDGSYNGSIRIRNTATVAGNRLYSELISVQGISVVSTSVYNDDWSFVRGYDKNKKLIGDLKSNLISGQGLNVMNGIDIPSTVYYIDFGVRSGVNAYISQPMLVFQDTVGTYVQGNYNNNAALAQVKITADSVSSIVSNPTTGLSTRVQTAEGTLSKVQGIDIPALQNATFWQPYSSLNFDDYTKQGSIFFNTTAVKINGPTTSNSWLYLIVEQGTADNSRIKQTAWYDGVAGVKITYVRTRNDGTWSPWYANDNDSVTTISKTNSDVKQEIADRKTGDSNTLQSSKEFTQSSITSAVKGVNSTISQTSNGIIAQISGNNMISNSEFSTDADWSSKTGNIYLSLSVKDGLDGKYNGQVRVTSTTANSYQGFYHKLIPIFGGGVYSFSAKVHYEADSAQTSGGRALLDIWFVDKDANRISSASVDVKTSNPYWNVVKSENVTAPDTAVYVQINFLVNSTAIGQKAYFGQVMMNRGSKVLPYAPNDDTNTVLALFKDNWGIGITDNISKITSGVVGNSNSMSLISKNVIIDSPSTQITGTAWINSAMIKDGSIGTAQIGDASITSAKIIDLDVSRLTGNTTQFIKSNWDSAYGNVSIDPDSISLSSKSGSTVVTNLNIGNKGIIIQMPGVSSFITSTTIDTGGIRFNHDTSSKLGSYASFGLLGNGFNTQYSPTGGAPVGITIGDGANINAADMAFGISVSQNYGNAPQLIWAGSNTGKISSSYRTWDNPAGFIIADNIKFSTWDNTSSTIEVDDTVNYYNYAPVQVHAGRFAEGVRSMRWYGKNISSGAKWFGLMNGQATAGFGIDNTEDVLFFVKGQVYSLYTMLGKLGMR